jgi:hypothetical protein
MRPAPHEQADPKILDPAAEIDAWHAQRYGHFCVASPLRPALRVVFANTQWQQTQAENIDATPTKAAGNTPQVSARRLLRQQVPKRADSAIGRIHRSTEAKIGHLPRERLGTEPAPYEPPSKVAQRWLAEIEAGHLVTSGGQRGD